jgi:hypothetical protein
MESCCLHFGGLMIFSCQYNSAGRILVWNKGNTLAASRSTQDVTLAGKPQNTWALVERFPKEVLTHDGKWAMENLRISRVINSAVVEVELGR